MKERYAAAAAAPEAALCCPVNYDPRYLTVIPDEVIQKDYGCGDPSRFLAAGETVLDLGAGAGKICFIAAQVVGSAGRVIGVDMTEAMLEVARRNAPIVAENVGFANVEFRRGRIQDLALDLDLLEEKLAHKTLAGAGGFLEAAEIAEELRADRPLVESSSIDVVVSNCVLNLVAPRAKELLFRELFRVVKTGGRAVISDIISERPVPAEMRRNPELWSGCISGAMTLDEFGNSFRRAGFDDVELLERGAEPWRVVEGIAFWSVTVRARKTAKAKGFAPLKLDLARAPSKCC